MSAIANEKLNWLDQVKADAEAITRERLQRDMPKMEAEVAEREAKRAPRAAKPKVETKAVEPKE